MSEKTLVKTLDSSVNNQWSILLAIAEREGTVVAGRGGEIAVGNTSPANFEEVRAYFRVKGYDAAIGVEHEHGDAPNYSIRLSPYDANRSQMIKRLDLP